MNIHALRKQEETDFIRIWQECFGDSEEVIREFLSYFKNTLRLFVLEDEGRICASLSQFRMGSWISGSGLESGPDVLVSYAIGTEGASRGRGYGSAITAFARDRAVEEGNVSLLCPANQGLVDFYRPLGYQTIFRMNEGFLDLKEKANAGKSQKNSFAASGFRNIPGASYCSMRERFLQGRVHISLSEDAVRAITECAPPEGAFWISSDDSVIFAAEAGEDPEEYRILECLTRNGSVCGRPRLIEILQGSGRSALRFRVPLNESDGAENQGLVQAMAVLPEGLTMPDSPEDCISGERKLPWFGFPFE